MEPSSLIGDFKKLYGISTRPLIAYCWCYPYRSYYSCCICCWLLGWGCWRWCWYCVRMLTSAQSKNRKRKNSRTKLRTHAKMVNVVFICMCVGVLFFAHLPWRQRVKICTIALAKSKKKGEKRLSSSWHCRRLHKWVLVVVVVFAATLGTRFSSTSWLVVTVRKVSRTTKM